MPPLFASTRWSLVLTAGGRALPAARRAFGELFEIYRRPLLAYLRARGHGADEAEELLQGYFTRMLEKEDLAKVDRDAGRFRAFLLRSIAHFAANERARARALKRGGGAAQHSIDAAGAEPAALGESPEHAYERAYALAVLDRVFERMEEDYVRRGRADLFAILGPHLTAPEDASYLDRFGELGLTRGALKVAAHRARQQFARLLRAEVRDTLKDPSELDEELAFLLECLAAR